MSTLTTLTAAGVSDFHFKAPQVFLSLREPPEEDSDVENRNSE